MSSRPIAPEFRPVLSRVFKNLESGNAQLLASNDWIAFSHGWWFDEETKSRNRWMILVFAFAFFCNTENHLRMMERQTLKPFNASIMVFFPSFHFIFSSYIFFDNSWRCVNDTKYELWPRRETTVAQTKRFLLDDSYHQGRYLNGWAKFSKQFLWNRFKVYGLFIPDCWPLVLSFLFHPVWLLIAGERPIGHMHQTPGLAGYRKLCKYSADWTGYGGKGSKGTCPYGPERFFFINGTQSLLLAVKRRRQPLSTFCYSLCPPSWWPHHRV